MSLSPTTKAATGATAVETFSRTVAPNGDISDRDRGGAAEILFARFREEDVRAGKLVSKDAALKNLVKSRQPGMRK